MSLEPITRMEAILAGEDITPVTRMEYFTKEAIDNAGSGGGGGEKFIVTVTGEEEDDNIVYSADKSVAECIAAYEENKVVVCHLGVSEDMFYELPIVLAAPEAGVAFALAIGVEGEISTAYVRGANDGEEDNWQVDREENVGGSSKFVVTFTVDESGDEPVVSADKSISEIASAYESGAVIEGVFDGDFPLSMSLETIVSEDEGIKVGFGGIFSLDHGVAVYTVMGASEPNEDDQWIKKEAEDLALPDVDQSGADDDKYLVVDHDRWRKSAGKIAYEFGFTVESDGQGGYSATADSGSTYAAIAAAMAETPNVIAKVTVPNPTTGQTGETHKVLIDYDLDGGYLTCSKVVYSTATSTPILIQLDISSSDVLTPRLITLTAST